MCLSKMLLKCGQEPCIFKTQQKLLFLEKTILSQVKHVSLFHNTLEHIRWHDTTTLFHRLRKTKVIHIKGLKNYVLLNWKKEEDKLHT